MTIENDVPLCPNCGTKMRPAGSTFVCESCGSTKASQESSDPAVDGSEASPGSESPRSKRRKRDNSWLKDHYEPTDDEEKEWEDADLPSHIDIVAGFLVSNNLIFGVPDKAEIFRLDELRRNSEQMFGAEIQSFKDALRLHFVQPSPIPAVYYTLAHPPLGAHMGDIVEVNYNVRLQALIREMHLVNIRVIHGSETDDSPKIVFEGTEYPGAAVNRKIRVVRITVRNQYSATWETVSETTYLNLRGF